MLLIFRQYFTFGSQWQICGESITNVPLTPGHRKDRDPHNSLIKDKEIPSSKKSQNLLQPMKATGGPSGNWLRKGMEKQLL